MHQWEIKWESQATWSNPLTGWTSGADPLSNLTVLPCISYSESRDIFIRYCNNFFPFCFFQLTFNDVDSAVLFAQKNGWKYSVAKATSKFVVEPGTFNYAQNFLPKKVTTDSTAQNKKSETISKADTLINAFCASSSCSPSLSISPTPHRILRDEVIPCHAVPFYSMQTFDLFLHFTFSQCIHHPSFYIDHYANLTLTCLFRLLPDNGAR